ncbi:MAG TPA: DUF3147 family protein [Candidatus Angelobacter sp.]|nr:DUF3147 family protein [Candidatus Angelobacter sp.]
MWRDLLVRFLIGGTAVTSFALLGDLFKPKSFAGLFGAAPSIALASLALAFANHGREYAAIESKSMLGGAVAFFLYSQLVSWLLVRYKIPSMTASTAALLLWFAVSLAIWSLLMGQASL